MTLIILLVHSFLTVGVVLFGGLNEVVREGGLYQFGSAVALLAAGGCWWSWGRRVSESSMVTPPTDVSPEGDQAWSPLMVKAVGGVLFLAGIDELCGIHEAVKEIWSSRYLTLDDGVFLYGVVGATLGITLLFLRLLSPNHRGYIGLSLDSKLLVVVGACSAIVAISHDTVGWFHWHGNGVLLEEMGEFLAALCLGGFAITELDIAPTIRGALPWGVALGLLCGLWIYSAFTCAALAAPPKHLTATVIPEELWQLKFPVCGRLKEISCYERREVTSKVLIAFSSCLDVQAGLDNDSLEWISPQTRDEQWVDVIPYMRATEPEVAEASATQPNGKPILDKEVPDSLRPGPRCSVRRADLYTPFTLIVRGSTEVLIPVVSPVIQSIDLRGIQIKGRSELCVYEGEKEITLSASIFGKSLERADLRVNSNIPFTDTEECRT